MRILQRCLNSKLNIEHSLQTQSNQRSVLVVEASELPDCRVSGQPLFVPRNELGEMRATNLFFTFDHPFNIAGNISSHLQERINRHKSRNDVSLVIARSSRIDSAILHCCRERSILPQLNRFNWLHIIMIVEDKRPSSGLRRKFSEYYGRTFARREYLHRKPGLFEKLADQLSSLTKSKALG